MSDDELTFTPEEFVKRMILAGWTKKEAKAMLSEIEDEPLEDQEGQL